jgi:cell division transport system ATP-binding protein
MPPALTVSELGKLYKLYDTPRARLRALVTGRDTHRPHWALKDVAFALERGQCLGVIGVNGAGKSTLLKLIALIERPTSGQVIVDGQNTSRVRRRKIPGYRRQIGMVFQDHKLLYDRPVAENVALPLIIAGASPRDAGKRVRAALDQVGLLHKEKKNPETLSAGEQQRVGLARAIVTNEVGVTLLIASHDIALIDKLGCRRIELEEGRLQAPQHEDDLVAHFDADYVPQGGDDGWR